MIEKVNPSHPDKIADRIAGALVDCAYSLEDDPKVAFEVLIGHDRAYIIAETSVSIPVSKVHTIVERIAGIQHVIYNEVAQDVKLAHNQNEQICAGDNGIFKGVPLSNDVIDLNGFARFMYDSFPTDGKYILADGEYIICQSYATGYVLESALSNVQDLKFRAINPLGYWTGGLDVDTGAVNRKLGSDMGEAVTGGGLHGKDLSKADVSVNIYAHLKAQETGQVVNISCAIGDEIVDGKRYSEIVEIAGKYINNLGGFEKLAEWGLV